MLYDSQYEYVLLHLNEWKFRQGCISAVACLVDETTSATYSDVLECSFGDVYSIFRFPFLEPPNSLLREIGDVNAMSILIFVFSLYFLSCLDSEHLEWHELVSYNPETTCI